MSFDTVSNIPEKTQNYEFSEGAPIEFVDAYGNLHRGKVIVTVENTIPLSKDITDLKIKLPTMYKPTLNIMASEKPKQIYPLDSNSDNQQESSFEEDYSDENENFMYSEGAPIEYIEKNKNPTQENQKPKVAITVENRISLSQDITALEIKIPQNLNSR